MYLSTHPSTHRRPAPSGPCCSSCTGADGGPKRTYTSEAEAKSTAAFLELKRHVWLRVYTCPHGEGWHLTSQI
jgi:hypothetical protein